MKPTMHLGHQVGLTGRALTEPRYLLPTHHLVTHGVVLGMTGSGKTGLVTVLIEEALRNRVPVIAIDVKGDLPNLLLSLPSFAPEAVAPWIAGRGDAEAAARLAAERREGLLSSSIDEGVLASYHDSIHVRVVTPGSDAGELLHVLSSLERRSDRWANDEDGARAALSAAVSLILRLLGRDADPARSRDHVLLSVLAERRLREGQTADLPAILDDVVEPPIDAIGALSVDAFMSKKARKDLAAALNNLLAAPTFASWRRGESLDVGAWMKPVPRADGAGAPRTPATIISVAHLDDDERELVLGLVLEEILTWVRSLPGSQALEALVVFDETYGFLPPHPANPPTKRPIVALMKQARAFGVGVVVATQNPMDLDYRALSNAGLWCLGRLQTDADRGRVIDGLAREAGIGASEEELAVTLKRLAPRWFLVRDVHAKEEMALVQPRWAMSLMRGPMTRGEVKRARGR